MTRAVQAEPTDGGRQAVFSVTVVFLIKDEAVVQQIQPDDAGLGAPGPIAGHPERFRFVMETVADEDDLDRRLAVLRSRERPGQFLLVSDALTLRHPKDGLVPSALASRVRTAFRVSQHLCGMVALAEPPVKRVRDIDVTIPRDGDRASLRAAILKAATGLRLKAPPPVRAGGVAAPDVRVEVVQSPEQLRACLALRKQVYGLMGYLPDDIMADSSGLELDGYDIGAIHVAAMHGNQVVGTARLVAELPDDVSTCSSIGFEALETYAQHRLWSKSIARRAGRLLHARALNRPYFPLPILQSSDFSNRWAEMLERTSPGAELSRLVVDPAYRGLHISANLVRMVIAKAFQLNRQALLLECIPAHVAMYSHYGFRPLSGDPHTRPTDLDQFAIGMWFRFDESTRVATAAEDLLGKIKMRLIAGFGPIDVATAPLSR